MIKTKTIIMLEKIQGLIRAFLESENLNTYQVRKLIREGKNNPLGASINVVDNIIKYNKLPSKQSTIINILDAIGAEYKLNDYGSLIHISDGKKETNTKADN